MKELKIRTRQIKSLEQWNIFKAALIEKKYTAYQFQDSWKEKNGFHARFINNNGKRAEVVTFNKNIQEEIISYNSQYRKMNNEEGN